MGTVRAFLTS